MADLSPTIEVKPLALHMSIAAELARFVTGTSVDDLPPLALARARMAIASTIASAAMGADIVSSRIVRELARERGGAPDATAWIEWADVDAKYRRLVPLSGLPQEKVEASLAVVHRFDAVKTVSELTRLLH